MAKVNGHKRVYKHGEMIKLPMADIICNDYNPNELTADEFEMLIENIEGVDFIVPLLVVPIEGGKFRIIDGEHRFDVLKLREAVVAPCVVADPGRIPELEQKFQTVRMNVIRGKPNKAKLSKLVEDIIAEADMEAEDVAYRMGFGDYDEFLVLVESVRESLPDEAKADFDKAKGEIKTVEDLNLLINRLFAKYGETLPYNFMIIDFGGKKHLWVRMSAAEHKRIVGKARSAMAKGVTFDSVVAHVLSLLDIDAWIDDHRDFLEAVDPVAEGDI